MNEPLRRALLRARLRENDVAARLGVDPKTVRRWLNGRVPYTSNRLALADLLDADEADLWPGAGGPLTAGSRPEEMGAIYPHRWAMPREIWARFFESAEHEIGILAYSALFLAEDAGIIAILAEKGRSGVAVRIALGDPDSSHVARRGDEEGIGDAMPAKIRNALTLFGPLAEADKSRSVFIKPCCITQSTGPMKISGQPAYLRDSGRACSGVRPARDRRKKHGHDLPR